MAPEQRKQLAMSLESVMETELKKAGVLVNGIMLNRLEVVSVLIAEIATLKTALKLQSTETR